MFDALTLRINRGADVWAAWALDFLPAATFFAAIFLLIVALGRRLPAPLRYALLLLAVARFLAPALAPLPLPASWRFTSPAPPVADAAFPSPNGPFERQTAAERPSEFVSLSPLPVEATPATSTLPTPVVMSPASAGRSVAEALPAARPTMLAWLFLAYLAGVCAIALWIGVQAFRLRSLTATSRLAGGELEQQAGEVARELGLRRRVAIRITEFALPPQSFGVCRPTVVLPASAVESLAPEELRLVLAHELGHHARWDPAAKWLQFLAAVVWWFHPLVWILGRQLDRVREQCCDELVLARGCTSAADYCRMLVHLAEHALARPGRLAPAQAMHPLRQRMQRLLTTSLRPTAGLSRGGMAVIALVAVAVFARAAAQEPAQSQRVADNVPAAAKPEAAPTASQAVAPVAAANAGAPLLSAAGVVFGPNGKPLPGARVRLRESYPIRTRDDFYDSTPRDVLAEITSDERGEFRFENVPSRPYSLHAPSPAPWTVVATAPGHGLAFWHLSAAKEHARMELSLKPEFVVRGKLVDAAGAPIANAKIGTLQLGELGPHLRNRGNAKTIELWRSQLAPAATTDAGGRFELQGLPPGIRAILTTDHPEFQHHMFYVATSTSPQANVDDGRTAARNRPTSQPVYTGDFVVSLERGARMEGQVVLSDTGAPVAGARVVTFGNRHSQDTLSDAEGHFEFHGLPFGTFQVYAQPPTAERYLGVNLPITLEQAIQPTLVRAELPVGRTLRGRVVDPETNAGVAGVNLAVSQPTVDGSTNDMAGPTVTDAAGEFAVAVSSQEGTVTVEGPVPGYAVPHRNSSQARDAPLSQSFVAGDVSGPPIRIVLPKGITLEGMVRDLEGRAVPGVTVALAKDRNLPEDQPPSAVSDAEGKFRIVGISPAKALELKARLESRRLFGAARVEANEQGGFGPVEILADKAASARGKVLSAGQPLAGVKVQIFRPVIESPEQKKYQSWFSGELTVTDHAGVYEFPFLEPGDQLYVSVEQPSHNQLNSEHFDLVAGQDKELTTISLNRLDRYLSGVVVDPRGRFVEGARVTASFADGRPLMRIRGVRDVRSGADGRFELDELPNEPLEIMAYFDPPEGDMTIRFPARVEVAADAQEVRLVLDPKLSRPR